MTPSAPHLGLPPACRGHQRAGPRAHEARAERGPDVQARQPRVDPLELALVGHDLAPGPALLSGLEQEADRGARGAGRRRRVGAARLGRVQEPGLPLLEELRGTEEHRHVRVVPAGVHYPLVLRVRKVGGLLEDREGVHVGAEGVDEVVPRVSAGWFRRLRRRGSVAAADRRHDPVPGPAPAPPVLHSQLLQHGRDLFVRHGEVEAQLGRLVEGPAELGEPGRHCSSRCEELGLAGGKRRRSCCCCCCCRRRERACLGRSSDQKQKEEAHGCCAARKSSPFSLLEREKRK